MLANIISYCRYIICVSNKQIVTWFPRMNHTHSTPWLIMTTWPVDPQWIWYDTIPPIKCMLVSFNIIFTLFFLIVIYILVQTLSIITSVIYRKQCCIILQMLFWYHLDCKSSTSAVNILLLLSTEFTFAIVLNWI